MIELIGADIIRDGGSIGLDYRKDGKTVSVPLEVNSLGDGVRTTYGHLHVGGQFQNGCDPTTSGPKGSDAENSLVADLDALMRCTPTGARQHTLHWLAQLRERLPGRTG